MNSTTYKTGEIMHAPNLSLPEGTRLPKGWTAIRIGAKGEEVSMKWSVDAHKTSEQQLQLGSSLRITLALNIPEEKRVEVFLSGCGTILGTLDIRYGYLFQPFELKFNSDQTKAVLREGIGLRTTQDTGSLWIFDDLGGDESRRFFTPNLLFGVDEEDRTQHFLDRILSLASLQPFGWLEGCVLDGLYDLRQVMGAEKPDSVISAHLNQFINSSGHLIYEDLHSRPVDNELTTIEATLPVGVLAKQQPDHPVVERAMHYLSSQNQNGVIMNSDTVTAEGAYTIAYPMAVVASRLNQEDLAVLAVRELINRRDSLADGWNLYLRNKGKGERRTFRNWARGYAWYMLGMTRTWIELRSSEFADLPGMKEVEEEIQRIAEVALSWRQPDGLWTCFLDDADTGIETSGSSGIAAALALGTIHGLLPRKAFKTAEECLQSLGQYLSQDGILHGVSQHNAGGEELQRSGYRVYAQMGMGLMAQLYAAVYHGQTAQHNDLD